LASFFSSINLSRMASIWELANPQLRDITVYEPGKPIEETARELGVEPEAIIKLASNENPLGPSPKAIQAMRAALGNAHLYPDGQRVLPAQNNRSETGSRGGGCDPRQRIE
jgi:histidinol-phosphate/aromatic aminotransferase/cobyric acid decarboxylase-like protein